MSKDEFQSDKIYSTFWWIITLDPKHPSNYNPNVKEIHGYSKRIGHDEARDKGALLMKRIIMLHSRGYFEKSRNIKIYMKRGDLLNKENSQPLLKLQKQDYEISSECLSDKKMFEEFFIKKGIQRFLNKFYESIKEGKDVNYLRPNFNKYSKDDLFKTENYNFRTKAQLWAWGEKMIRNGHPPELVMNFTRKYLETRTFPEE